MQQDMTTGFYTISVLEGGEGALDPLSTSTMEQVRETRSEVLYCFSVLVSLSAPPGTHMFGLRQLRCEVVPRFHRVCRTHIYRFKRGWPSFFSFKSPAAVCSTILPHRSAPPPFHVHSLRFRSQV